MTVEGISDSTPAVSAKGRVGTARFRFPSVFTPKPSYRHLPTPTPWSSRRIAAMQVFLVVALTTKVPPTNTTAPTTTLQ
ncbi:hypothetical protein [Paraburkholderia sp.]|jgi:hypothetical protein|uniref:hypothetical protein n=1 Tax=Paraburkholderia sp. TaxID=1926495 RepID=UPI002F414810